MARRHLRWQEASSYRTRLRDLETVKVCWQRPASCAIWLALSHCGSLRISIAALSCRGTSTHESLLRRVLLHCELFLEHFSLWLASLSLIAATRVATHRTSLGATVSLLARVGRRGLVGTLSGSIQTRLLHRPILIDLGLLNEVLGENMLHHHWLDFGMLEALRFRFSFLHILS